MGIITLLKYNLIFVYISYQEAYGFRFNWIILFIVKISWFHYCATDIMSLYRKINISYNMKYFLKRLLFTKHTLDRALCPCHSPGKTRACLRSYATTLLPP